MEWLSCGKSWSFGQAGCFSLGIEIINATTDKRIEQKAIGMEAAEEDARMVGGHGRHHGISCPHISDDDATGG
jgi:hypothetical protein